ncbi:MAG: magnesium transporter CorA family protein [Christensenellaceae bacterium]|nr:magnesium transporter CorA family protein [Christensenellaceae bacterium]
MIKIVNTGAGRVFDSEVIGTGSWVHLTDPTNEELESISEKLDVRMDFLRAALDEEETVRIENEDGQRLILVDIPVVEPQHNAFLYNTLPLGIILTKDNVVTVCLEETNIVEDFWNGRVKNFDLDAQTRFILQILYRNAKKYLQYLRQIDKASTQVEDALHRSMKNRELIQMLRLEKSLVFFSTSLKSNEMVLEKIMKTRFLQRTEDETDLLEDVIIENKQAIEMCTIYRDILSGTMDAFASVISNNLNIVMKLLASITIVLSIPTMIASFWGMNVADLPFNTGFGFWPVVGIAGVATGIATVILWRKKMF